MVRIGAFLLLTDIPDEKAHELRASLLEALREDSRVAHASTPRDNQPDGFADRYSFFRAQPSPEEAEESGDVLLSGRDQSPAVQFWDPILMTVHVPLKNQPNHSPNDAVAAQDYEVLWDGWIALVSWTQDSPDDIPFAGGQVLADILRLAAEAVGAELYVQACSPYCDHLFNHTNVVVQHDASSKTSAFVPAEQLATVTFRTSDDIGSARDAALALYVELGSAAEAFAQMKNIGRRVLDLERAARGHLLFLMKLLYSRAHVSEHTVRERPRMLWNIRGWRQHSRTTMARMWVMLTAIQEVTREWEDRRRQYLQRIAENPSRELVFAIDEANEVSAIESLDTRPIREGIAEASDRLDHGALVLATLGTGAAAIAGVIVGHFL